MSRLSIKRLVSGGIIINYDCVSDCGHCLYNCGPHRSKQHLEHDDARRICRKIRDLGCTSVHIGGGEPLLRFKKLFDVLAAARESRLGIDMQDLGQALPSGKYPLLDVLAATGIRGLYEQVAENHGYRASKAGF